MIDIDFNEYRCDTSKRYSNLYDGVEVELLR